MALSFHNVYLRRRVSPVGPDAPPDIVVAPRYILDGDGTPVVQWMTASIPGGHQMRFNPANHSESEDTALYEVVGFEEIYGAPVLYVFETLTRALFEKHCKEFGAYDYVLEQCATDEDIQDFYYTAVYEPWWQEHVEG